MISMMKNLFYGIVHGFRNKGIRKSSCSYLLPLLTQAAHKKKSVSCPAGGQNCGQSGGRNFFFFFRVRKYCTFFFFKYKKMARTKKKSFQLHLF